MALIWNRNGLRKPVYRKEYYYDDLAVIVSSDDCLCSFIARQSVCDVVIYLHLYPSAIVYSRRYSSICAYDLLHSFHRHFSNRVGVDTSLTPIYHTKFNHQRNSVYNTGKKKGRDSCAFITEKRRNRGRVHLGVNCKWWSRTVPSHEFCFLIQICV